ncbi:hypothetical protein CEXT_419341 [Caerostris extrusa]|uniref:Uncharacterized protein n=1 Tax=Caerostris extrusa TaxID=172846 RepID=A0AAV4N6D4_CAEEX|nr:hypothetical protein CEXT_419341 [Caerostris extrusa]
MREVVPSFTVVSQWLKRLKRQRYFPEKEIYPCVKEEVFDDRLLSYLGRRMTPLHGRLFRLMFPITAPAFVPTTIGSRNVLPSTLNFRAPFHYDGSR